MPDDDVRVRASAAGNPGKCGCPGLKWRREKVVVNSNHVACITFTGWHKFFSESRGWVSVVDLRAGETLRTQCGTVRVASVISLPVVQRVYNFTVENDHVYNVGDLTTLTHNNGCAGRPGPTGTPSRSPNKVGDSDGPGEYDLAPEAPRPDSGGLEGAKQKYPEWDEPPPTQPPSPPHETGWPGDKGRFTLDPPIVDTDGPPGWWEWKWWGGY